MSRRASRTLTAKAGCLAAVVAIVRREIVHVAEIAAGAVVVDVPVVVADVAVVDAAAGRVAADAVGREAGDGTKSLPRIYADRKEQKGHDSGRGFLFCSTNRRWKTGERPVCPGFQFRAAVQWQVLETNSKAFLFKVGVRLCATSFAKGQITLVSDPAFFRISN